MFNNTEVHFLKKPIMFKFKTPLNVRKSTYNYKLREISEIDRKRMMKVFRKLNPSIASNQQEIFINADKGILEDMSGNSYEPSREESKRFKIKTLIQGFKVNEKNIVSPMWSIKKGVLRDL
jgi:hypothetical protein